MPQLAVRGIYRKGKIIPLEDIPCNDTMNVIIVFTDKNDDESRYYENDWQHAEEQASYDYKTGNTRSASSIDEMFEMIEGSDDGNQMVP